MQLSVIFFRIDWTHVCENNIFARPSTIWCRSNRLSVIWFRLDCSISDNLRIAVSQNLTRNCLFRTIFPTKQDFYKQRKILKYLLDWEDWGLGKQDERMKEGCSSSSNILSKRFLGINDLPVIINHAVYSPDEASSFKKGWWARSISVKKHMPPLL